MFGLGWLSDDGNYEAVEQTSSHVKDNPILSSLDLDNQRFAEDVDEQAEAFHSAVREITVRYHTSDAPLGILHIFCVYI